jgi:hypothetical protein
MLVYHRTHHSDATLRDGFRDSYKAAVTEAGDMIEFHGVWMSADSPLGENQAAHGPLDAGGVIELDIPEVLFTTYEWVEEGKTYRESMIPADKLKAPHVRLCKR